MMKRYLAFLGVEYTAKGGMHNFVCDRDTLEEAKREIYSHITDDEIDKEGYFFKGFDNFAHVWDSELRMIVWEMEENFENINTKN